MVNSSSIEWTDTTWNPVSGCRIISDGCKNCYAMRMSARLQAMGLPNYKGVTRKSGLKHVWTGSVNLNTKVLTAPLRWKKSRLVFVNSMSDLFQDAVPLNFCEKVWGVMEKCPQHTFQILTKQPERMAEFLNTRDGAPLPNVWIGTSVEDSKVKNRIRHLRDAPAYVRFISFEPLIGRVGHLKLDGIHWSIVGGESGPGARPMLANWVEEIYKQCKKQSVSFFFKQWGGVNKKKSGRIFKGKTWNEMPALE